MGILTNKGEGGRGKKRESVSIRAVTYDEFQEQQAGDLPYPNEVIPIGRSSLRFL